MMLHFSDEEIELFDRLDKAKTEEEWKEINEKIREIALKQQEELKDCPFCH